MSINRFRIQVKAAACIITLLFTCGPASADTEQSFQLYGGYADTKDTDLDVELLYINPPRIGSEDVNGSAGSVGLRYLFTGWPLPSISLGFDLSRYKASADNVQIDLWPLTFELIYTLKGHVLEPYVGIGYSLTYAEVDVSAESSLGVSESEENFADGMAFLLGVSYPFKKQYSVFFEYRYDRTDIDFKKNTVQIYPLASTVAARYSADLETNRLLLGFSFKF